MYVTSLQVSSAFGTKNTRGPKTVYVAGLGDKAGVSGGTWVGGYNAPTLKMLGKISGARKDWLEAAATQANQKPLTLYTSSPIVSKARVNRPDIRVEYIPADTKAHADAKPTIKVIARAVGSNVTETICRVSDDGKTVVEQVGTDVDGRSGNNLEHAVANRVLNALTQERYYTPEGQLVHYIRPHISDETHRPTFHLSA